jgi:NAD(P)-dependent dehydrogenase (short-subunit alcohol dehydrogenase family)
MGLLEGRAGVVTGGASGIGLATSKRLIAEGARVAIVDVNKDAGEVIAKEIGAEFVAADISIAKQVDDAFETAIEILGSIDIAHLNAGVTTKETDILRVTPEEFRRVFGINIDGVVYGVHAAVKAMKGRPGSIVATASIAGITGYQPDPIYASSKHAVVGLVRSLAPQLSAREITINCICPGIVDTPLLGEGRKVLEQAGFPLIAPEEIAEAVVRAIAEGGTGQAWVVQPGREPLVYEFRGVPGPRTEGAEGTLPPGMQR